MKLKNFFNKKPSIEELDDQVKIFKDKKIKADKLYRKIFISMPEMFKVVELIYDKNGNAIDYYYRDVNKAFELYVKKTRKELIGNRLKKVFNKIDEYWLETYARVVKSGTTVSFENFETDDGRCFEILAWKVDTNSVAVIFADITDRKVQELTVIRDKEEAEENDRIKNDFISNLSHEIRTPMNGILGFTKFLSDPDLTDTKRKHYLSIIENSGNQLMRTMDDLLEISKLATKQVKAFEKELSLNDLLLELFTIFDIKAKENKTPLYLRKGLSDVDSRILTDETKLYTILSNLLENALKFTTQGFVEFGYKKINSTLEIYVKDTGIGVHENRQASIFKRFSKEENILSRNVDGLGLGLSIAKENTELIGGEITLKSKKGEGSTFFITIPYKPTSLGLENSNSAAKIEEEEEEEEEEEHKCTILVAEDEEINYLFLEILLKKEIDLDCIIIHAKNGEEAVEICDKNPDIDLILMDLKMPVMDGFEATRQIKELRPNVPIVAQTAFSSAEDKRKVFSLGFDDFLSKPISKEALSAVINKQQERRGLFNKISK